MENEGGSTETKDPENIEPAGTKYFHIHQWRECFFLFRYCNSRIMKFSSAGKLLNLWGKPSYSSQGIFLVFNFVKQRISKLRLLPRKDVH